MVKKTIKTFEPGKSISKDDILTSSWTEENEESVRESGIMVYENFAKKYEGFCELLGSGHLVEEEWFEKYHMRHTYYLNLYVNDERKLLFRTHTYDVLLFAKYALKFLLSGNRTYVGKAREIDMPIDKVVKKMLYPDDDRYFDSIITEFHCYYIERLSMCF